MRGHDLIEKKRVSTLALEKFNVYNSLYDKEFASKLPK
jgi:hypothetical protein